MITTIINSSIESSTVPDAFKQAVVRLALKSYAWWRCFMQLPSNCELASFVKACWKGNCKTTGPSSRHEHLTRFISMSILPWPLNGYGTTASEERLRRDVGWEGQGCTCDVPSVQCIRHYQSHILMNRLQHSVGITDATLSWLHSYIAELYQRVAVDSTTSADCVMKCDMPQGSVLEPMLCCYTRPIGDIVARHGLQYHRYADDIQIYMAVKHNHPIT